MISLRDLFIKLGLNDSDNISLTNIAQEHDLSPPFQVSEFIQAASGSPDPTNKNFTTLPIDLSGDGGYRADRFRIYFRNPFGNSELSIPNLVKEFGDIFPQLFNGKGSIIDATGYTFIENIANTFYRSDFPFNGEPTMQFNADLRVLFNFIDAPDLHDDWVGFVHQNPNLGFAVQTLKRNFGQLDDAELGAAIALAISFTTGGGGPIPSPVVPIGGGVTAAFLNRYHFLSGRRSWVIARANQARGTNFISTLPQMTAAQREHNEIWIENHNDIYIIETAAIDRFSGWIVELANLIPGVFLSNMDVQINTIWSNLLQNFVRFHQFSTITDLTNIAGYIGERREFTLHPTFSGMNDLDVFYIQETFSNKSECLAQGWVKDMLQLHPGIAEQF